MVSLQVSHDSAGWTVASAVEPAPSSGTMAGFPRQIWETILGLLRSSRGIQRGGDSMKTPVGEA